MHLLSTLLDKFYHCCDHNMEMFEKTIPKLLVSTFYCWQARFSQSLETANNYYTNTTDNGSYCLYYVHLMLWESYIQWCIDLNTVAWTYLCINDTLALLRLKTDMRSNVNEMVKQRMFKHIGCGIDVSKLK